MKKTTDPTLQFEHFSTDPKSAAELLSTGNTPQAGDLPAARRATAAVLLNTIMNFDESVRQQ